MGLLKGAVPRLGVALLLAVSQTGAQEAAPVRAGDHFGDWTFSCEALGPSRTRCALVQELMMQDGAARILRLTLGRLGSENEMALLALAPLGVYLPAGVAIKVDQGEQVAMQMQTCVQAGCEAALRIDNNLLKALKRGRTLFVGFKSGPAEETITVPASLAGISQGIRALDAKR